MPAPPPSLSTRPLRRHGIPRGATPAFRHTTPDVTTTYDALGRVGTVTQASQSRLAYTYDPADLALDTETVSYDLDHNGAYEFVRTLDRSHDALGRSTGYDLKSGADVEFSALAAYHQQTGRLATVGNGTQALTYGYQPGSHLVQTVTGSAHVATSNWEANRDVLASKVNTLASGGALLSSIGYTVNNLGQRTNATRAGAATNTTAWDYDGLGQVVLAADSNNASNAGSRAFEYDTIGNRKKSAVGTTTLPGSDNYATDARNRYTAIPSAPAAPVYDDDGNATTYPLTPPASPTQSATLAWDAENRLLSTTVGGNATTYQYDALGRRIAKITAGSPAVFLYEGWNLIAEYTGASRTLRASFLWGSDLSGSAQGAGGVGGLLAARLHTGTTGVYYPLYDGNGIVTEYLDINGDVKAHYEYGPFGEPLTTPSGLAAEMPFRFSTKYQDAETGLLYYGYRYYDPITGRWPSRDPIEENGGNHLYRFSENSPVGNIDVDGLWVNKLGIITPGESVRRVQEGQKAGDRARKLALGMAWGHQQILLANWIYDHKAFFQLATIGLKHHPGGNTDGNNRWVYTCRYGWIDMGHFFYSAALANLVGVGPAYNAGIEVEKIQRFLKRVPGLEGFSASAWTPEDLISDYNGAVFGDKVGASGVPENAWRTFLTQAGAVAHKGDAKWYLDNDVDTWAGERFKNYDGAIRWQFKRLAHKCLCDGIKPKPEYRE